MQDSGCDNKGIFNLNFVGSSIYQRGLGWPGHCFRITGPADSFIIVGVINPGFDKISVIDKADCHSSGLLLLTHLLPALLISMTHGSIDFLVARADEPVAPSLIPPKDTAM